MELFIFHMQPVFYKGFLGLLVLRFMLNFFVYALIDSDVTKEMTEMTGKGIFRDSNSISHNVHYLFTFWFPIESFDTSRIKILKKCVNFVHISFLVLGIGSLILWSSLEEINYRRKYQKKDPLYFMREQN